MTLTLDDIRDDICALADATRDLATAQDRARSDREAIQREGRARGETVVAQIETIARDVDARLEAVEKSVDELRRAKSGAPWPLVYSLIGAVVLIAGTLLSLYARSQGDDASAAFEDARRLLPAPSSEGTTPETEPSP